MARKTREEKLAEIIKTDSYYWQQGMVLAGVDEAGRGPLAGNVVAACVVMPPEDLILWIDDSKKLSPQKREDVFEQIQEKALFIGIGQVTAQEIDEINILQATKKAMRDAVNQVQADYFLIDGRDLLGVKEKERAVIHGDAVCYTIAAASIIAKVTRDRQLLQIDRQYPEYGFAQHKGYGTAAHIEAIQKHGPCPIHRRSFLKNILAGC